MYDDAGDSLLHVLPGALGVVNPLPRRSGTAVETAPGSIDFEFNTLPTRIAERYALIVSYHYCHPTDGWSEGHQVDHARASSTRSSACSRRTSSARRWAS